MPYRRFLLCNLAGALLWAGTMVSLAWLWGRWIPVERMLAGVVEFGLVALGLVVLLVLLPRLLERFNRAVRAAMPYVDGPRFIESDRLAPFNPRGSDVAVVLDLMIHDLDLVHTLVGSPVADVQAMGIPVLTPQLDIANARLTFANGAVANITASRVSRERLRKLRIFQRSGYLSLDLAAGTGEFFRLRGDFDPMALARAPRALEEFVERVTIEVPEGEPLVLELSQFLGAIMGRNAVAVTGEEGREALEAALRIVSAIEQAHRVMQASEAAGA
jgi:predicted dehydrogenase